MIILTSSQFDVSIKKRISRKVVYYAIKEGMGSQKVFGFLPSMKNLIASSTAMPVKVWSVFNS